MCGIVGYLGPQNAVDIVLEGLARLEYRGYDSAGVCFKNERQKLEVVKKEGKLENLISELKNHTTSSHIAIGHTRWATHGIVNDKNAHPHFFDEFPHVSIVHNGIIENFHEIKKDLESEGIIFHTETDSEAFLGLLAFELKSGSNLKDAIVSAFKKIEGNSALVVINDKSNELFAIKKSAPLVCGKNSKTNNLMVSSDPYALVGHVSDIYFPEDEVLCELKINGESTLKFFELDGRESRRFLHKIEEGNLEVSDKGHFDHYMQKEIYEQPGLIRSLAQKYLSDKGLEGLKSVSEFRPSLVHISACGTAWHAGLIIKNYLETVSKVPTVIDLASEFRYRNPLLNNGELGLFISQSGETADTLAAQELCKKNNLKTISIVNVDGSTLFRDCDFNLLIHAGVEIGVASTKAFTLQVLTGRLYAQALAGEINKEKVLKDYSLLADRIDELLNNIEKIKNIAEEISNNKGYIFTGRGIYFPVALEGALKLKEIAYVHAEGYAAGELKHGPIALIDEEMVNIAFIGPELYDKTYSNLLEVKARKGIIVGIGPKNDQKLSESCNYYIPLNFEGLGDLAPLYTNVVGQLLSYYLAKYKGTDIDKPRNLAKSVTVE
ncbi:MAG: glutamine--fructose-6-phosphate transaminase (isomerizing) [Halobacteriovoraceae bacterium]|nr:glutamine--fructose-6-phosphate transaminase (isomerizing) [Halobacteriovoraceae bacterium]